MDTHLVTKCICQIVRNLRNLRNNKFWSHLTHENLAFKSISVTVNFHTGLWLDGSVTASQSESMLEDPSILIIMIWGCFIMNEPRYRDLEYYKFYRKKYYRLFTWVIMVYIMVVVIHNDCHRPMGDSCWGKNNAVEHDGCQFLYCSLDQIDGNASYVKYWLT